jgi:hypothetical protein
MYDISIDIRKFFICNYIILLLIIKKIEVIKYLMHFQGAENDIFILYGCEISYVTLNFVNIKY